MSITKNNRMGKKTTLLGCAFLSLCLSSCSPSLTDENSDFLNRNNAAVYYCTDQPDTFAKITDSHDLSKEEFPDEYSHFCAFAVDASNKGTSLSKNLFNRMHDSLKTESYVFCYFYNLKDGLSFLNGTDFEKDIADCYRSDATYITVDNNTFTRHIEAICTVVSGSNSSESTVDLLQVGILDSFRRSVEKILLEE